MHQLAPYLTIQNLFILAAFFGGLVIPSLRKIPAGAIAAQTGGSISRLWAYVKANPKTSIAGLAAGLAGFLPKYAGQIGGAATAIGFFMTSDAEAAAKPPAQNTDESSGHI